MTDEEFKQHVEALVLTKLEEPKKMAKQCDIYWDEITSHQYHFDRGITRIKCFSQNWRFFLLAIFFHYNFNNFNFFFKENVEVEELKKLTKSDVVQFFNVKIFFVY